MFRRPLLLLQGLNTTVANKIIVFAVLKFKRKVEREFLDAFVATKIKGSETLAQKEVFYLGPYP